MDLNRSFSGCYHYDRKSSETEATAEINALMIHAIVKEPEPGKTPLEVMCIRLSLLAVAWNCRSSRLLKMIVRTSSLHEVESHHRLIDGNFEPAEARHPLRVTILSGKRSDGKYFLGVFLSKTASLASGRSWSVLIGLRIIARLQETQPMRTKSLAFVGLLLITSLLVPEFIRIATATQPNILARDEFWNTCRQPAFR